MRALVAVDDVMLAASCRNALVDAAVGVELATDCDGADAALRERHFDAVVIDRALSNGAGEALVRGMRARSDATPVLVLTGPCSVGERVRLLDLGADDYLTRPVDAVELAARVRALIRRTARSSDDRIAHGPLQLLRHARVAALDGKRIELTNREFWILDLLMRNVGKSLSRRQLEEALYGWGDEVESNAIEVHIHHLRRKLGPGVIQTVRGVGYQLAAEAPAEQPSA